MEQFFRIKLEGRTPIWIDETNFNLYLKKNQGWSKVGIRASVVIPANIGANLHIIGAISGTRLVNNDSTRRGSFKRNDYMQWFRDLLDSYQQGSAYLDHRQCFGPHQSWGTFERTSQYASSAASALFLFTEPKWTTVECFEESHKENAPREDGPTAAHSTCTEQMIRELENTAIEAIRLIRPGNRLERQYFAATRQEFFF